MIICPACGYDNTAGTLYCEECAEPLVNAQSNPPSADAAVTTPAPPRKSGDIPPEEETWLRMHNSDRAYGAHRSGNTVWLMLQPEIFFTQRKRLLDGQLLLGRLKSTRELPALHLDVPGIEEMGVSRLHAALIPVEYGVAIMDIGSTNGTRLNHQVMIPRRSYNLSHGDILEMGKLALHLHFIEKTKFLRFMRDKLVARFDEQVQTLIKDMKISEDAMVVLLQRLPGNGEAQFRILNLFKERREPVTLSHLHRRINKIVGDYEAPLKRELPESGNDTSTLESEEPKPGVYLTDNQPRKTQSASVIKVIERSAAFQKLFAGLHHDAARIEKRMQEYLTQAEKLPDFTERQEAINMITPILIQLHAWLPTIKPDKDEATEKSE